MDPTDHSQGTQVRIFKDGLIPLAGAEERVSRTHHNGKSARAQNPAVNGDSLMRRTVVKKDVSRVSMWTHLHHDTPDDRVIVLVIGPDLRAPHPGVQQGTTEAPPRMVLIPGHPTTPASKPRHAGGATAELASQSRRSRGTCAMSVV